MRRTFGLGLSIFLCFSFQFAGQAKVDPKDLAPHYQEWLRLTTYIMKNKEKDVFMQLTNDRDRDLFIETFWRMRDPTPGTPENEYKDEIVKRFNEANVKFRRTSARAGWQTDQGRIYIILGPPSSIERIEGDFEVYSCEIWSYYGGPEKGTPPHFSLVFFQRGGGGEYRLYDPVTDGPGSLLIHGREMDPTDFEAMYERIFESNPTLAISSLSIIPGEIPYGFQPSPLETILMANILESPKKAINETYATHFLNYKGVVSTEYLTNYMESDTAAAIIKDPLTGMAFCDFSMAPRRLSLDYYEPKDEFFCAFQVDVSLRSGEKIIFQYAKEFPLTIPSANIERTRRMGISIEDSFPVIEGKYKLTVLLRNTAGKEFSILERDVEIPRESGTPRLGTPVLGYRFSDIQTGVHVPYQARDKKINIDPKNLFAAADEMAIFFNIVGLSEELWKDGSVGILIKGAKPDNPYQKSLSVYLNEQAFHQTLNIARSLSAAEFPPDYYDLTMTLKDGRGTVLDEQRASFVMSAEKALPHPLSSVKAASLAASFMFSYMLAHQYDRMDENEKAEAAYKKALDLNPTYKQRIPDYAEFLLKVKKFRGALDLIETIKEETKLRFPYYLIKGRAFLGLEKYAEAVANLAEGNKIYNSDTVLLNALGYGYYKTGQVQNALNVLNASLKLNPNQEDTKKLIQEIEGKKK
jgi:GWxTD domain-containing protein